MADKIPIVIEGIRFASQSDAYREAVSRGCKLAYSVFWTRLNAGCDTFAGLCAKVATDNFPQEVVVDGVSYPSIRAVFREAKARGFAGSQTAIFNRVKAGMNTWTSLFKEKLPRGAIPQASNPRKRLHDVCAELDRRREEIRMRQEAADKAEDQE